MQLYSNGFKMVRSIKLYKSFDIKNHHKKSIILIGNFDGLHLGHQKLFKLANKYKKKFYSKTGVLTFDFKKFFDSLPILPIFVPLKIIVSRKS